MRHLLLLLFFLSSPLLFAQIKVNGIVTDPNGDGIPFAHIGIPGKSVGTASFENGRFTLSIPNRFSGEELKISAIGFEEKSFLISEINPTETLKVTLSEKVISLKEFVVSSKKQKPETLFESTKSKGSSRVWFGDSGGGTEMFTKVTAGDEPIEISQVNLRIGKNTVDTFRIRFGFYEVTPNNLPGERLVEKSFIVESSIKRGTLEFELGDESVWVEGDFYMGFEWIVSEKQRQQDLANRINWVDYGVKEEHIKSHTISTTSGKLVQVTDDDNNMVQEIKLTKSQRKEIYAKLDSKLVTYLDMSGNHKSLYRVRSYADFKQLIYSPYVEIIGYRMGD